MGGGPARRLLITQGGKLVIVRYLPRVSRHAGMVD
jgi:hypothetical protein